jgi:hypothetical protein
VRLSCSIGIRVFFWYAFMTSYPLLKPFWRSTESVAQSGDAAFS